MRSVALKELKIQLDAILIQWIKNAWRIDEKLNPDPHVTSPDCYWIQSYQDTDHQVKGGPRKTYHQLLQKKVLELKDSMYYRRSTKGKGWKKMPFLPMTMRYLIAHLTAIIHKSLCLVPNHCGD